MTRYFFKPRNNVNAISKKFPGHVKNVILSNSTGSSLIFKLALNLLEAALSRYFKFRRRQGVKIRQVAGKQRSLILIRSAKDNKYRVKWHMHEGTSKSGIRGVEINFKMRRD